MKYFRWYEILYFALANIAMAFSLIAMIYICMHWHHIRQLMVMDPCPFIDLEYCQ